MRARLAVLVAALMIGCSSGSEPAGAGGSGGGGGSGGSRAGTGGGGSGAGTGGSAGVPPADAGSERALPADATGDRAASADAPADSAPSADAAADATPAPDASSDSAGGAAGARAVLIVGQIPLVRTDVQLHAELAARGLMVEDVLDARATTATATGARLLVISYSVESANVRGKFNDVTTPIIVMEHVLLDGLGMTSAAGHGWMLNVSQITMTGAASPLSAGLTGDVTILERPGGVFWGVPADSAIKVATAKGNPARSVIFAYPAGAMMVGRTAPGKRMLFFLGGHLDTAQPLTPQGIKLLHAAIDWSVQ